MKIKLKIKGEEKRKIELFYVYNIASLSELLKKNGFNVLAYYADFIFTPFKQNESEHFVVIAEKVLRRH